MLRERITRIQILQILRHRELQYHLASGRPWPSLAQDQTELDKASMLCSRDNRVFMRDTAIALQGDYTSLKRVRVLDCASARSLRTSRRTMNTLPKWERLLQSVAIELQSNTACSNSHSTSNIGL